MKLLGTVLALPLVSSLACTSGAIMGPGDEGGGDKPPDNVVEKIVESGLKTFYKEVCLADQAYIHDPVKSVAQAVKESEGKIGAPVAIKGFVRYALGEGIEKQEQDFAAEVAAAAKTN